MCPPSWAEGAVQNRFWKITDKFCLVVFLLYLALMIVTSIYAFWKSDPKGISKVYDSSGNICGEDKAADYPLLLM